MGANSRRDAAAIRRRAREARVEATALRTASRTQYRLAEELADRLSQTFSRCSTRALGDRGESYALELARLRPMVRFARNDLRRWLEQTGVPAQVVHDVTLACSEACSNAVEHPRGVSLQRFVIEAHRRRAELEVRVRDFGSWIRQRQSELRGRGLSMIDELMDSVDVHRTQAGSEIVMHRSVTEGDGRAARRDAP